MRNCYVVHYKLENVRQLVDIRSHNVCMNFLVTFLSVCLLFFIFKFLLSKAFISLSRFSYLSRFSNL